MQSQIDKRTFAKALEELGHDPAKFSGKRLSINNMQKIYGIRQKDLLQAIEEKRLQANYSYESDDIWIDALEAAYFYYCQREEKSLLQLLRS